MSLEEENRQLLQLNGPKRKTELWAFDQVLPREEEPYLGQIRKAGRLKRKASGLGDWLSDEAIPASKVAKTFAISRHGLQSHRSVNGNELTSPSVARSLNQGPSQNATQSLLLCFPRELRDKIYGYLLKSCVRVYPIDDSEVRTQREFCCQLVQAIIDFRSSPKTTIALPQVQRRRPGGPHFTSKPTPMLDTNILGVNKQIRNEAFQVLWTNSIYQHVVLLDSGHFVEDSNSGRLLLATDRILHHGRDLDLKLSTDSLGLLVSILRSRVNLTKLKIQLYEVSRTGTAGFLRRMETLKQILVRGTVSILWYRAELECLPRGHPFRLDFEEVRSKVAEVESAMVAGWKSKFG